MKKNDVRDMPTWKYNALMESAPELLKALKKIIHHQCYGTATSYSLALEDGKKAIKQAEGR